MFLREAAKHNSYISHIKCVGLCVRVPVWVNVWVVQVCSRSGICT